MDHSTGLIGQAMGPKESELSISGVLTFLCTVKHMTTKDTQNDHKDTLKYNHETQRDQVETQKDYRDSKAP